MKKRGIPLLVLLFVIAITIAIFLYREKLVLLGSYGYLGVFLLCLVGNATVILPVPVPLVLFALGAVPSFHPAVLGLVGGAGAAIGEVSGYMIGYSGRGIAQKSRLYSRIEGWVGRWGVIVIFLFSLLPLTPFDLAGIAAGTLRFPLWKFMLVCWLGRSLLYFGIALAGAWGWGVILPYLG